MKNILITGGEGYLGNFLKKKLSRLGFKVFSIDINKNQKNNNKVIYSKIDILDKKSLDYFFDKNKIDIVIHAAALVPVKKSGNAFFKVNEIGTKNLVNISKKYKIKKFVHISSSAVYGNISKSDCPIKNNNKNLLPVEPYGQSKANADKIIKKEIKNNKKILFSIARPRTILGGGRLGIFSILFEWVSEGKNIYVIGNGNNIFQFVHINDFVNVIINLIYLKKRGEFNVGTENYCSLKETLEYLCQISKKKSKIIYINKHFSVLILWILDKINLSPLSYYHYITYSKDYYFCLEDTKNDLDWNSKYSNKMMIKDSYQYYLKNKKIINNNVESEYLNHRYPVKQKVLKILKYFS
jgi:nucleoside-diphosphate-sugar epimerase